MAVANKRSKHWTLSYHSVIITSTIFTHKCTFVVSIPEFGCQQRLYHFRPLPVIKRNLDNHKNNDAILVASDSHKMKYPLKKQSHQLLQFDRSALIFIVAMYFVYAYLFVTLFLCKHLCWLRTRQHFSTRQWPSFMGTGFEMNIFGWFWNVIYKTQLNECHLIYLCNQILPENK